MPRAVIKTAALVLAALANQSGTGKLDQFRPPRADPSFRHLFAKDSSIIPNIFGLTCEPLCKTGHHRFFAFNTLHRRTVVSSTQAKTLSFEPKGFSRFPRQEDSQVVVPSFDVGVLQVQLLLRSHMFEDVSFS